MSEDKQNTDIILGQILGRMEGLLTTMTSISASFTSHALSDEKNFNELRKQMMEDKEEMTKDRIKIAKITGGIIILATAASYIAPFLLGKL